MLKAADVKAVSDGLADAAAEKPLKTDPKDLRVPLLSLRREADEARRLKQLEAYAKEPGAKVLPSGLIFTEVKAGGQRRPKETDTVNAHYHGTFPDGRVFDSSVQRGQPMDFPLNGVIPCWTEALQLMGIGGKAKVICPYPIAYGERGRPPVIPERATLLFDVELLDIK
ncbi:MAG: FKBP-type peptidyl-prolyl cis-trans isomerase [Elusimicrobia bacterium]|nr:FKBP-type peptidyl-prolyl cis-trans isomerase [Elusimicrobiota bacterium]